MSVLPPARNFRYDPPPKYAPKRDHSYLSEGAEIARVARLMGRNLMPWQRRVVDIATEYRIVGPGESEDDLHLGHRHYRYSMVIVTVPRQSGKTLLMGPVRLHRMMTRPGIDCFSTAQTGKDAGKRMRDLQALVAGSPIRGLFKPRLSQGSEGFVCRDNGSTLTRFAPAHDAIHGETPHLVDYDEFWKYTEELGDAMLGGVRPAMITIKDDAQIWMVSTRGTARSVFMNKWVKLGRAGTQKGLAYFEWSMPDGADPEDENTWWFHPALGNTQTVDSLREEMYGEGMTHAERMRGFMNVLTEAEDPIITPEDWEALAAQPPEGVPSRRSLAISYEVAPHNARAAVMASWRDEAGMPCSRVLHSAPGTAWLVPYVRRLAATWHPAVIAADDGGPSRRVTDELRNPTTPGATALVILTPGMRDYGTACDAWLSAARDEKTFKPDRSKSFRTAVAHTVLRVSNGTSRIDRDKSTGPVCEVIASAVGQWAYDHQEATIGAPAMNW
ncbi:phage-related terminase [Paenarthrobacter nicotinovorans]|uniref:terminase large subunit n=1 Tax=Paenarthrobacter nicotinovorans TaxID=29320 RepID=UPI0007CC2DA1|nr:terminase large subunit [Paenarthrobacter nicotinovorans]GAT87971.1 phage-related terminase [Paenarthrobacter nicotinovorans]